MRTRAAWSGVAVFVFALAAVAFVPATTRRASDAEVSVHAIPLYEKALHFMDRDLNYRRLTAMIIAGEATDEARAHAVFSWTRAHVRNVPPGFPVVDDHVWHIIVRGYGSPDQRADVFATLATYAGVPAYWIVNPAHDGQAFIVLARINGSWRSFDVEAGREMTSRYGVTTKPPAVLRAELQMIGPRLVYEVRRLLRVAPVEAQVDR